MKRVLFVCERNAARSQIAEAFARLYGSDELQAYSAGTSPADRVDARAIAMMAEVAYDLSSHRPKPLSEMHGIVFDAVIAIGYPADLTNLHADVRGQWDLPDPDHLDDAGYRELRGLIGRRVKNLINALEAVGVDGQELD